ncbi:hypothetical protein BKA62DRAFT_767469 [Auriculariales sp. MPI-PUGE-AT-0066]|nr:hypothetical protein BKA62DRAFT_767469 [Auriculariales sp. MPI-PUGE-AT-0066]
MCNTKYKALTDLKPTDEKRDETRTIITPVADGYWINPYPFHTDSQFPDIIAYGLGVDGGPSTIKFFTNPLNNESPTKEWAVTDIASFTFPVGMSYADFRGNGLMDFVICDRYGPTIYDLYDENTQDGGRVVYMVNPGKRMGVPYWEQRKIGNVTGMHRLQCGRFTREDVNQAFCFPVIKSGGDFWSPAPVVLFDPIYGEDFSQGPQSWTKHIAFDQDFRIIHDLQVVPRSNKGLDTILVAGREGICHLYFDTDNKAWSYTVIGAGTPKELGTPQFWGSGSVDYCRIGDDDFGYVVSCEAFHGNTVAIYLKNDDCAEGTFGFSSFLDTKYWTRHVIDSFGPLDDDSQTGTIHNVRKLPLIADVEPFAVACMGEPLDKPENQGVYMYVPVDIKKAEFKKIKIHGESSARMALGCYSIQASWTLPRSGNANSSYYVPGYHVGPDPSQVRISHIGSTKSLLGIH